jgi:hypothetical protein
MYSAQILQDVKDIDVNYNNIRWEKRGRGLLVHANIGQMRKN